MTSIDITNKTEEIQALLDSVDTFLFDCDGVIWHGDYPIQNVCNVLTQLRAMGKRILFVSNNSTKSRRQYLTKFNQLNIEAYVCIRCSLLHQEYSSIPRRKKVYVVGMSGIQEELDSEGINHIGASADNDNLKSMSEMSSIKTNPEVGAVLFGFDLDLNYKKLAKAFTCHLSTGALLASLSAPLGRRPVVIGKPEPTMMEVIVNKFHLNRERTCMVGDRLDTDILFGQQGGLKTLLVLTGVTPSEGLEKQEIQADYVIDSLGSLL
ncbi:UNVERIFIED_CONTAM: hypothetical protein HDU68_005795 [Siphonaria sp. JEL0065]|nr:hypothetical protein HDU68_005795 [Siphonaria sp. JEL0065]